MHAQGLAEAQATIASTEFMRAGLLIQSTVNAFVDTFAYQAGLGLFALLLILFFRPGRSLVNTVRWIINVVR